MPEKASAFAARNAATAACMRNIDWVENHPDEVSPHAGAFIVVVDERIVATGTDDVLLGRAFLSRPDAYIHFVEPPNQPRKWRIGPITSSP